MQKSSGAGDRRGSGREIPHAGNPSPPRLQRFCKRNGGAGLYARVRGGWAPPMMVPQWIRRRPSRGKRVFPENFSMRNTGAAGRGSRGREIPHARRAPAAVPDVRRGESGGGFLCACDAGGASMRLHVGFMMDPTAARGPDRVPPRSGCGICRGPPAALPPAGKFPMRPKRVRRACRSMGSGAGEGRPAIKWKAREASGCDRPRLRELMRMRGTRDARYLQTLPQPYSYVAILRRYSLLQPYSYAEYAYADILCRYSLLQLYSTVDITATAAILTSHTHNVLPTHLIPSSLKVSHRSSSLPP